MIDRRSLIALGLAVPAANTALRLDLPDPRIHSLNTDGIHVTGISPDASRLVGVRDLETICILDASTREVVAESDPFPEMRLLDESSIQWSPDGERIAFGLMPWVQVRDSDIFMMDISSGQITNLTPEGYEEEAHSLIEAPEANVDTNPVWLDDDTLIFSRHAFVEDEDNSVTLTTLPLSDEASEAWVDLSPEGVMYVTSPIWQTTDGSMVFGTESRDTTGPYSGAMVVSPDGTSRKLDLEDLGHIQVVDVNDTHMVAHAAETYEYWYIPLDAPTERENLWERFELPGTVGMRSEVTLGPDPDTVLVVVENETDQTLVLQLDDSGSTEIAEFRPEGGPFNVHWAEDVILITSKDPAWLILPED